MPTIRGPILDSSGRPATGQLRVRATRPFDVAGGHVTQAVGVAEVHAGVPVSANGLWTLPVTPSGVWLVLEQDLDGEQLQRFTLTVPDVETLTYSELLFNRGGTGDGGANPYWWDLTGGLDFPPDAINGDWGYDNVTGQVWRYEA